jgi:hypothetical protein
MNPNDTPEIQQMLKSLREMEDAMHPNPAMRRPGRFVRATNLADIAAMLRKRIIAAGGTIPHRNRGAWG